MSLNLICKTEGKNVKNKEQGHSKKKTRIHKA